MPPRPHPARGLREACVDQALAIIGDVGVEALSIREVARRLGVSHQAPYKHFPSSDHLLAEVVRRTYRQFSEYLEARPRNGDPGDDLKSGGVAYFSFAREFPLHYRLLFSTPLPDPAAHPEMMAEARHAFQLLYADIGRVKPGASETERQLDALFVWATVHGLASLMQTAALDQIGLDPGVLDQAMPHALHRIGKALAP